MPCDDIDWVAFEVAILGTIDYVRNYDTWDVDWEVADIHNLAALVDSLGCGAIGRLVYEADVPRHDAPPVGQCDRRNDGRHRDGLRATDACTAFWNRNISERHVDRFIAARRAGLRRSMAARRSSSCL